MKYLIHGGPQGAWGDDWSYRWNPELFAANGYVVVMVNFHGSTGYGQKFIDAINGNWGGAPYQDLMLGLDYAEKTYPFIDKDRECALGASYGGYAINWIEGHTNRFKCLVSHDGMFNTESAYGTTEELWFNEWEFKGTPWTNRELYRKWSPHLYATNFKTPMLVVHGQLDYRLDVSEGFQLFTTLQRLKDSVEDAVLPRRRPLGAEAAEQPALVQDGEWLGGPVDEAGQVGNGNGEKPERGMLRLFFRYFVRQTRLTGSFATNAAEPELFHLALIGHVTGRSVIPLNRNCSSAYVTSQCCKSCYCATHCIVRQNLLASWRWKLE